MHNANRLGLLNSSSKDDSSLQTMSPSSLLEDRKSAAATSNRSLSGQDRKQRRRLLAKTQSEGVAFMRSSLDSEIPTFNRVALPSVNETETESKLETLSELVKMSAKDLPEIPDFGKKARPGRRPRLRAMSDGVSLMRSEHALVRKSPSNSGLSSTKNLLSTGTSISNTKTIGDAATKSQHIPLGMNGENSVAESSKNVRFLTNNECLVDSRGDITGAHVNDHVASDDGESDIDDVPDALSMVVSLANESRFETLMRKWNLALFFHSYQYRVLSLIFGPMVCFFFIS